MSLIAQLSQFIYFPKMLLEYVIVQSVVMYSKTDEESKKPFWNGSVKLVYFKIKGKVVRQLH